MKSPEAPSDVLACSFSKNNHEPLEKALNKIQLKNLFSLKNVYPFNYGLMVPLFLLK